MFDAWTPEWKSTVDAADAKDSADKLTITYTATWKEDKNNNGIDDQNDLFKVVYELAGGTTTSPETIFEGLIIGDTTPRIENPVKEKFAFDVWNPVVNATVRAEDAAGSADKLTITYTAQWVNDVNGDGLDDETQDFTVKYVLGNGEDDVTYTAKQGDNTPTQAEPNWAKHTFIAWNPAVAEKVEAAQADETGVITYTAQWKSNATSSDDITTTSTSITIDPTVPGDQYIVIPKGTTPTEDDWNNNSKTSDHGEAITFNGLDPNTDYDVISRTPGDDTHNPSEPSDPTTVTTDKEDQEKPDAVNPDDITTTDDSITIDPTIPGDQYIVVPKGTTPTEDDWTDKGQTSENGEALTFDGLDPNTEYDVIVRKPGDDTHNPSEPSDPTTVTTDKEDQEKPDAINPDDITTTSTSITIEPTVPGDQYIVVPKGTTPTEDDWNDKGQTSDHGEAITFDGLDPNTDYDVISRTPGDDTHNPSEPSDPTTVTTDKEDQEKPDAVNPDDITTTDDSITIDPTIPGDQYIVVPKGTTPTEDDWTDKGQTSENGEALTFDGLDPNTEYDVIVRKPGDDTHNPSEPSDPTTVTTDKEDQEKPDAINPDDITTTSTSITIEPTVPGDQYIVVPKGTTPTEDDWNDKGQTSDHGEAITFDGLDPNTDYDVISRTPGDDTHNPSEPSDPTTVTTDKEDQKKPDAINPDDITTTSTSITIDPTVPGDQYIVVPKGATPSEDDWNNNSKISDHGEAITFDGLDPNTEYDVISRTPGDDTHKPSEPSDPVTVETTKVFKLTIHYVMENGTQAFPDYIGTYAEGTEYNVFSPDLLGYARSMERVSGTITEDTELTVIYTSSEYTLLILYRYEDGREAAPTSADKVRAGETYLQASPSIQGYRPSVQVVTGEMPARNLTITVVYTPNNGSVIIDDYETPLGLGNVGMNLGDCYD